MYSGDKMHNLFEILKSIGKLILANIFLYFVFAIVFLMTNNTYISYLISYIIATITIIIMNYKFLKIDLHNIKEDYKNILLKELLSVQWKDNYET